jgi:hypothetical protein
MNTWRPVRIISKIGYFHIYDMILRLDYDSESSEYAYCNPQPNLSDLPSRFGASPCWPKAACSKPISSPHRAAGLALVSQPNYYSLHMYTDICPTVSGCSRTNASGCITRPHEAQHRVTPTIASDGIMWGNAVEVGDDEG